MMNKIKFEEAALDFLEKLFSSLHDQRIEVLPHWDVDHICYRVDSLERYEECKKDFLSFGTLLIESDVNGRPIATFKLNSCLHFKDWTIDVVELPAPKPSKPTAEGFEHIEVVCDKSFAELEKKYQHLSLDRSGLKKDFNQELELDLGTKNLKFHHMSLESVIRVEENKKVFHALKESNILSSFKEYTPFVAGTFPLGIYTESSDLDILMYAKDLGELEEKLRQFYAHLPEFKLETGIIDGMDTLIANFFIHSIPFEVFAQAQPVAHQKTYLHFQIEERLLKMGGTSLKKRVMEYRQSGMKTEPAFGKVLKLVIDPYEELLLIQKRSSGVIKQLLESV